MPSSTWTSISDILDIMMSLHPRPKSVLDIGIGNGKYGFLAKEYLHYWGRRYEVDWRAEDGYRIVGIEAFPDYLGDIHRLIYNEILVGDVVNIFPSLADVQFDLVLMIDVLEHFDIDVGRKVLDECQRVGKVTIVSTPIEFEPQLDAYGNEFERHRSLWTEKQLYAQGAVAVFNSSDSNWIAVFTMIPEWRDNIVANRRYNSNLRKALRYILPYHFRTLFRRL